MAADRIFDSPLNEGVQLILSSGGVPPALEELFAVQFVNPNGPKIVQLLKLVNDSQYWNKFGSCNVVNDHSGPETRQVSFLPLTCQP